MRETLQTRCRLFIQNRDAIKAAFRWEYTYMYPLSASILAARNMKADVETMRHCRTLLKQKTGVFSNFRGTPEMATLTMLSMSSDPEAKIEYMTDVYSRLKKLFWGSEYLAVAAATITEMASPAEYDAIVARTRSIYDDMKKAHPFLTSGEDSTYAALLALSGLDDAHIAEEAEQCYTLLRKEFAGPNAVQSLSHILSLGEGSPTEKCEKTVSLYAYLREHGYKYGKQYELSTLGVLALLDVDIPTLAQDIMDADDYLKDQKGFGALGVGVKQRLMHAGMLTMADYVPAAETISAAALNGIVSIVIAQQAAMCAAIAGASAAAAASASASS